MSRPDDDLAVFELGDDTDPGEAPDAGVDAIPPRTSRRAWVAVAVGALVAGVTVGALLVHRSPTRPAPPVAAQTVAPTPTRYLPRLGGDACTSPDGCTYSPSRVPSAGVRIALSDHFPTVTDLSAQILIDPGTGEIRSQYVTGRTPAGVRVTVSITYDGEQFRSPGTYHRDFSIPPTLYFDRHTFEGWQLEVTAGGVRAADAYEQAGLDLVNDPRLLD